MPTARMRWGRICAWAAMAGALGGCPGSGVERGSGRIRQETYRVAGATSLSCELPVRLRLTIAEPEGLALRGDDNLLPYVEVKRVGTELRLGWKPQAPEFTAFTLKGDLRLKRADLAILGATADLEASYLNLPRFQLVTTGASRAAISGNIPDLTLRAGGASYLSTWHAWSQRVQVEGTGTSRLKLRASEALTGSLTGGAGLEAADQGIRRVALALEGSAEAKVWAVQELEATLAGHAGLDARPGPTQRVRLNCSGNTEVWVRPGQGLEGQASGFSTVHVVGKPPKLALQTSGAATLDGSAR